MKHARSLTANEILELVFIYLTEVSSLREYDDVISVLADMGKALTSSDRCLRIRYRLWMKLKY